MMKNFFNNKVIQHSVIFLLFVFIAFAANRIPSNSFIAGGDFYQLIDPDKHFTRYLYAWINQIGQGSFSPTFVSFPYYAILAGLSKLGLSSGFIAGFIMFFFLYASFLSFYFSIKLLYPSLKKNIQIGGSLIYALNNFTLVILTYPWGYTHHFLFYIFIPPLVCLALKILLAEKNELSNYLKLSLVLTLAIVSLNNLAFLLALVLLQVVILALMLLFRYIPLNRELFKRLAGIIGVYFVILLPLLLILSSSLMNSVATVSSGKIMGGSLEGWLKVTGSTFLNTFTLTLDKFEFPWNYSKITSAVSVFYFLILAFLIKKNLADSRIDQENKKSFLFSLIIVLSLLLFAILSVRYYSVFAYINLFIYKLPFFNAFRSADKIFALIPFLLILSLVGLFKITKTKDKFINLAFLILALIPLPFYAGKLSKYLLPESVDGYKYIVSIPDDYNQASKIVNQTSRNTSIVSLPYSVVNSIGWANYPKWGFIGADVLHLKFDRYYISANYFDNPDGQQDLNFKAYNDRGVRDDAYFLSLLEKFSAEYVIWHKDIDPVWIKKSKLVNETLASLERDGHLKTVMDSGNFKLYKLEDKAIKPLISSTQGSVEFTKNNPTNFRVKISNLSEPTTLSFNQGFSPLWSVYSANVNQNESCLTPINYVGSSTTECTSPQKFNLSDIRYLFGKDQFRDSHQTAQEYANSWKIDPSFVKKNWSKESYKENSDGSIDLAVNIIYSPQALLYGMVVYNGLIAVFCIVFLLFKKRRNEKKSS